MKQSNEAKQLELIMKLLEISTQCIMYSMLASIPMDIQFKITYLCNIKKYGSRYNLSVSYI